MLILLLALLPSLAFSMPSLDRPIPTLDRPIGCTNWMFPSSEGTFCFVAATVPDNYDTAKENCVLLGHIGGNVASIHNAVDNEITRKHMDRMYWLGAAFVDGKWTWDDRTEFDYSNWAAGGNNPSKGHCIAADHVTGLWVSRDCSDKLAALCETSLFFVTVRPSDPPGCPDRAICYKGYAIQDVPGFFETWTEAEQYCQDEFSGHLVSIHDNEEEAIVEALQQRLPEDSYIGGYGKNNSIFWSDGTTYSYTSYFPWETPDHGFANGRCMQMHWNIHNKNDMGWWFTECDLGQTTLYNAICKYKLQ